jgi:hypothetical protein
VIAPYTPWRYWGWPANVTRIAATPSHSDQKLLDIRLALVLDESTVGMGSWRVIDKVHELWEREKKWGPTISSEKRKPSVSI